MLSPPVMTSITESSTTVTLSLAVALNAAPGLAIIGVTLSGAPMVEANNPSTVAVICAKTSDVFGRMGCARRRVVSLVVSCFYLAAALYQHDTRHMRAPLHHHAVGT